jgi:hypothetical protein
VQKNVLHPSLIETSGQIWGVLDEKTSICAAEKVCRNPKGLEA